jgi:hypothetical protein
MGWLTGAEQADETLQELAWSWGVPSIIPAGDLHIQARQHFRNILNVILLYSTSSDKNAKNPSTDRGQKSA